MRDEKRIDIITDKLNKFWHKFPDMRFWQLLLFLLEVTPEEKRGTDTFHWEDDVTEKMLDKMLEEDTKEEK